MRILPRDKTGALLKAADSGFSADRAYEFVRQLLDTDVDVAAILIDTSHPASVAAARSNTELVNQRRQAVHHRKMTEAGFSYGIFAGQLITDLLMASLERTGCRPTFFDVVLDNAALKAVQERQWRDWLRAAGANNDTSVGDVVWTSEQAEPLLLLPDLVAGILLRDAVAGDCQRARQALQDAGRAGRLSIRDGYNIPLPQQAPDAHDVPQSRVSVNGSAQLHNAADDAPPRS